MGPPRCIIKAVSPHQHHPALRSALSDIRACSRRPRPLPRLTEYEMPFFCPSAAAAAAAAILYTLFAFSKSCKPTTANNKNHFMVCVRPVSKRTRAGLVMWYKLGASLYPLGLCAPSAQFLLIFLEGRADAFFLSTIVTEHESHATQSKKYNTGM